MGLDEKPTNTASQTSKFTVFISAITLLVFFGGLVHVELILNTHVRHLEAQIQSIQPSTTYLSETENLESVTNSGNKEQHQQNEKSFGRVTRAEKSTEYEHPCDYGDCVQLENKEKLFHAKRTRRDIAMFMLFSNQTLEHLKMELSTTIYERLKEVILTQKRIKELGNQTDSKLRNDLYTKIRQNVRKVLSDRFQGLPGYDGFRGLKGEIGLQGSKGSKGDDGYIGLPGPSGPRGRPGQKGDKGDIGLRRGPKGDKGQNGDQGNLKGYPGLPGPRGVKGEKGDIGKTGPQGTPGLPGFTGEKGEIGSPGFKGFRRWCQRCK